MRNFLRSLLIFGLLALIAACGRGSGGDNTGSSGPTEVVPTADNVQAISVNAGPANTVNLAFTSITVCIPGTSQCRTIDNVMIDTGSSGLRLLASALSGLSLPQQTTIANHALVACQQFVDLSHMWGPVKIADVKIAGKSASSLPIQVIGNNEFGNEPVTCAGGDSSSNLNTVATLGGNGILGVGYFVQDCGDYCATTINNAFYYDCVGSSCTETTALLATQLQNPVALFTSDNNGVVINLPAISDKGSARVDGQMIFGIGTRDNNTLGNALIHTVDGVGYLTTRYQGSDYPQSFVDSGSNGFFFPDDNIPFCNDAVGFYCPASTLQLTATIIGLNNANSSVAFSVANTELLNFNFSAFKNLAGPYSAGFDWGLPFFYGRKVYTAFETNSQGSYIAF